MQLDLSKKEIELLDEALDVWEKEPCSTALISSIMATVMGGKDHQSTVKQAAEEHMEKAEKTAKQRRVIAIMMRAKLYQALTRETEHNVET